MKLEADLMKQFECDYCVVLTEYEYIGKEAVRFVQTMLMQSYKDHNTPVMPGAVLMCPVEGADIFSREDQSILRSGIGKSRYQMQYSRPDIALTVRDLVRHMTHGNSKMLDAMQRCMRFILCLRNAGLMLKPRLAIPV
jgi:hypothetical protein